MYLGAATLAALSGVDKYGSIFINEADVGAE